MPAPSQWIEDLTGQVLYVGGALQSPTKKEWDLVGFTVVYDAVTERVRITSAAVPLPVGLYNNGPLVWDSAMLDWLPGSHLRIEEDGGAYIEMTDGDDAALSNADEGRLYYSHDNARWEMSANGGAKVPIASGVATVSDVIIGTFGCPAGVLACEVVYLDTASGPMMVDKALATDPTKMPAIGWVISKPDATHAIVAIAGTVTGFGGGPGLTPGANYFVDGVIAGAVNTSIPAAPCTVQRVGFAITSTTMACLVNRQVTILP